MSYFKFVTKYWNNIFPNKGKTSLCLGKDVRNRNLNRSRRPFETSPIHLGELYWNGHRRHQHTIKIVLYKRFSRTVVICLWRTWGNFFFLNLLLFDILIFYYYFDFIILISKFMKSTDFFSSSCGWGFQEQRYCLKRQRCRTPLLHGY